MNWLCENEGENNKQHTYHSVLIWSLPRGTSTDKHQTCHHYRLNLMSPRSTRYHDHAGRLNDRAHCSHSVTPLPDIAEFICVHVQCEKYGMNFSYIHHWEGLR
jgi:hypothetical protein